MGRKDSMLVTTTPPAFEHDGADTALAKTIATCEILMSDIGEASMRMVAAQALDAYSRLDDGGKLSFFRHVTTAYDVDPDQVRATFHRWEQLRNNGSDAGEQLTRLFAAVEPARQQLLRLLNHAPGATLALVEMRSDLRRLMRHRPELRPLDHDFHHLLTSWFNRGFLRLDEVTTDSPPQLLRQLLQYETVHPMATEAELSRRLQPPDRRVFAFLHPATGELPLIFVEVALVRGIPARIAPLLEPGPALDPATADTAALYSINNALDGLAGVSFGSFLVKQVIEQVSIQLPHLRQFVTLSPIPGFRHWCEARALDDTAVGVLVDELATIDDVDQLDEAHAERIRARLLPVVARYLVDERREDGRPIDPVARFHLGNGAAAWRLNWPANPSPEAWRQSYGAMVNYRYEPEQLERRHEDFVQRGSVAVSGPLQRLRASS